MNIIQIAKRFLVVNSHLLNISYGDQYTCLLQLNVPVHSRPMQVGCRRRAAPVGAGVHDLHATVFYRIGLNSAISFPSWVGRSIFLDFSKNNFLAFLEHFFGVFKVILSIYMVKISYFLADSLQTWYLHSIRRWKNLFFWDFSKMSFLAF